MSLCQQAVHEVPTSPAVVAALGKNRTLAPQRVLPFLPSPRMPKFLPPEAELEVLKAQERREYRFRLMRRLAHVNFRFGIQHAMNGCSIFSGYSKEKDETGRQKRHTSVKLEARWDVENGRCFVHHAHLATCGGALVCPVCGAVIRQKRLQEVEKTCWSMLMEQGFKIGMLTLTARHDFKTDLKSFIKGFKKARSLFFRGGPFRRLRQMISCTHHIVGTEVTLDDIDSSYLICGEKMPSGWHFHLHILYFYKEENEAVLNAFENGWEEALKKGGFRHHKGAKEVWVDCLRYGGLDGEVHVAAQFSRMPDDVTDEDAIEKAARYVCKGAAFEATSASAKQGRKPGRIPIQDLQERVAWGEGRLDHWLWYVDRWREYIRAIKGEALIRFSPGLKALCGVEEKSDEDLLHGEEGDLEVATFSASPKTGESSYSSIAAQGGQGFLLSALERVFNMKPFAEVVKECAEHKGEKDFKIEMPPEFAAVSRFVRRVLSLASEGFDVAPSGFDAHGQPVYDRLDQGLENISFQARYDLRLPDICSGYMRRGPESFKDLVGNVDELFEVDDVS